MMNGADIITALAVGTAILLAAAILRRNKKKGKCRCGCQCAHCGGGHMPLDGQT